MLTIFSTHPIQYQAPMWRELTRRRRVPIEVIFFCDHGQRQSFDPEFGRTFGWDVDLLEGYASTVVHPGKSPSGFGSLHLSLATFLWLMRRRPKAIWIQGWQVAGYWEVALAARLVGAQLWLRGETNLRSGARRNRLVRGAALGFLFTLASRFLFIGKANRTFYLVNGVHDARLTAAPYCVDNEAFRKAAKLCRDRRDEIRRDWAIPDDAFCFLFVGKFIAKKRPLDIINAARSVGAERKTYLLWIGDGELLDEARTLATRLSAENGVGSTFTGFLNQSEIVKAYCAADCLILPSEADETWGLVVNEAMACGLPAIISNACGCAEDLCIEGFEQLIFPVGDIEALTRGMRSALERVPSAAAITQKIDAYDMKRTVEAVEELYENTFGP